MNQQPSSPEIVLSYTLQGMASTAALGAAATHSLFTYIEQGAGTVEEIARAASISVRGAQALLDAIVVPVTLTGDGLPLAAQVVGRPWDEPGVRRAARVLERDGPWRDRRPPE